MGRCRIARTAAFTALLLTLSAFTQAEVWYVNKANTSGIEDGQRWATAFTKIQAAVGATYCTATDADEIWIAEGTYSGEGNSRLIR